MLQRRWLTRACRATKKLQALHLAAGFSSEGNGHESSACGQASDRNAATLVPSSRQGARVSLAGKAPRDLARPSSADNGKCIFLAGFASLDEPCFTSFRGSVEAALSAALRNTVRPPSDSGDVEANHLESISDDEGSRPVGGRFWRGATGRGGRRGGGDHVERPIPILRDGEGWYACRLASAAPLALLPFLSWTTPLGSQLLIEAPANAPSL